MRFAQVEESNAPITISVLKQSEAILDDRGQIVDGDIVRRVDGRDVAGLDVDAVKVWWAAQGTIVDLVQAEVESDDELLLKTLRHCSTLWTQSRQLWRRKPFGEVDSWGL